MEAPYAISDASYFEIDEDKDDNFHLELEHAPKRACLHKNLKCKSPDSDKAPLNELIFFQDYKFKEKHKQNAL